MRRSLFRSLFLLTCLLSPLVAFAQTSAISGVVKDESGGALPGVTVEVSSPALIEKTRTSVTDSEGRYSIVALRPGLYSVTFTLTGFGTVVREGIELTSDFTANVNGDLKVGTLQESITVTGESPIVDTTAITQRVVMTRDVLDVLPTGRNIQAVGIMIPGTTLAFGGGAALSRDVGGSGGLQQSPLQFRGATDSVQTIEGLRLNNLCAQGAYSGVYWNDASFEELSYVTGADSAEMGQGGIRINMVPRDGGNQFRGQMFGNYASEAWGSDNCGSAGIGQPCTRDNLGGSLTFNPTNRLTNVSRIQRIWDVNPSIGGPLKRDKLWFYYTFRHWGVEKTVVDSYFDSDPSQFRLRRRHQPARHRRRLHSQQRGSSVVGGQRQGQDLGVPRQSAKVPQSLGHPGDDSARGRGRPGDADQFRQRDEMDTDRHQPVAARGRLRHLQPGIHRALPARGHRPRGQDLGPRFDSQLANLQRHRPDRPTARPTRGRTPPITSRSCGRSWVRPRT